MHGIHETTGYLELFIRNLLDEKNELHNRAMHISGMLEKEVGIGSEKVDIGSKEVDIENVKVDIRNKLNCLPDSIFEYKKATIEDVDELVRTRIIVLRAANCTLIQNTADRELRIILWNYL